MFLLLNGINSIIVYKCTDAVKTDNTVSKRSTKDEDFLEPAFLQSQLKEMSTVTRRSTRLFSGTLKPESDHKMVMLTRNINRAVSLPLERKSQLFDFDFIEGKERGQSVQRDQVKFLLYA